MKREKKVRLLLVFSIVAGMVSLSRYEHQAPEPSESRYLKIDMRGEKVHPWQGPWACVLDKKTGLVWENKTDDESIHDGYWTYSWFLNDVGVADNGSCKITGVDAGEYCDTQDLVDAMNNEATCGYKNWRLPTSEELSTLLFDKPKTGEALIANDFFPFTKRSVYWASEHNIPLGSDFNNQGHGAKVVDFQMGATLIKPYSTAPYLRLVTHAKK